MSLPHEIYAEIACYLPGPDGAICRVMAKRCIIRENRIYKYTHWQDLAFFPYRPKDDQVCLPGDPLGTVQCTYKNGQLHSFNDQPAYCTDKCEIWFDSGIMHRSGDRPALVNQNGLKKYVIRGEMHRDGDQPALITKRDKIWYTNGDINRKNGPAFISRDFEGNTKYIWYADGLIHNDNGPAYYDNIKTVWYNKGLIHNDKGPAVLYASHAEYWERGQPIRHITMIYKAFIGWLTCTRNASHDYFKNRR